MSQREEWKLVTPELAAEWLLTNTKNRVMDDSRVARYVRAMHRGEWRAQLGDPIRFANTPEGELLIDGQHRLTAMVEAGKPILFKVIRGLTIEDRKFIDQGKPRSGSDVATLEGFVNAQGMMSCSRRIMAFKRGDTDLKPAQVQGPDNAEVIEWMRRHPRVRDSMLLGKSVARGCRGLRAATVAAAHFILSETDRQQADQFMASAASGEGLPAGSPIAALRNRSAQDYAKGIHVTDGRLWDRLVHTYNAWSEGRTLVFLKDRTNKKVVEVA